LAVRVVEVDTTGNDRAYEQSGVSVPAAVTAGARTRYCA
jgi:hypothetical protein